MKKKIFLVFILCLMLFSTGIYAADQGYEFDLTYEGNIIVNEPKDGIVTLTGTEATPYSNVRVQSELVSGPATATIYAYDENGNRFDITESGAWGPTTGFAVGGTFTNETPITAVYPQAGTYVSRLSLIDLSNNNAVITSKEFTVTVYETDPDAAQNNVIENDAIENNTIENIPQAGANILNYSVWIIGTIIIICFAGYFIKNNKA